MTFRFNIIEINHMYLKKEMKLYLDSYPMHFVDIPPIKIYLSTFLIFFFFEFESLNFTDNFFFLFDKLADNYVVGEDLLPTIKVVSLKTSSTM
jgi:hypothetical protein